MVTTGLVSAELEEIVLVDVEWQIAGETYSEDPEVLTVHATREDAERAAKKNGAVK